MSDTALPTILFLDDDNDLRALMEVTLRHAGLQLVGARTLAEARRVLAQQRVDAAVVDGLLPDGLGEKLVEELRRAGSTLPLLFSSAFFRDRASHVRLTQQWRVAQVLRKPYAPADLVAALEQMLAPAGGATAGLRPAREDARPTRAMPAAGPVDARTLPPVLRPTSRDVGAVPAPPVEPPAPVPQSPRASAAPGRPALVPPAPVPPAPVQPAPVQPAAGDTLWQALSQELGRLETDFAARLPEKVAQVRAELALAAHGEVGALVRAGRLVHRLHGTAGSYGLHAVSAAAGRLEEALEQMGPGPQDWAQLLALLAGLERAVPGAASPAAQTA